MAVTTICNKVASYLTSLAATNPICVELGTKLTLNSNLYIGREPNKTVDTVTILSYPGSPPDESNQKYSSSVQIRIKSNSVNTSLSTCQAVINVLNMNTIGGRGLMRSNNSAPIIIGVSEGGEKTISVSNFSVRHIKIT